MPAQTGYFDTLKSVAGKVFSYLASITLTGTDGKTITVTQDTSLDEAVAMSSKMAKTGANLAIGFDADGDMYYRASSLLARLAKGAANLKLFMNAAGTFPEWAGGITIKTDTYDTATVSGDQVITGIGFKASNVIIFALVSGTSELSFGFDNGTDNVCIVDENNLSAGRWGVQAAKSITLWQTAAIYSQAEITAIGSDGYTLSWTKTGAKTGNCYLYCLAFR